MKPEFKSKWIEALRSGKYQQGQGRLLDEEGCMCCLGVLCEVSGAGQWDLEETMGYRVGGSAGFGYPPKEVNELTGLDSNHELVDLNDTQGKTFDEIATWIEANL